MVYLIRLKLVILKALPQIAQCLRIKVTDLIEKRGE